MDMGAAALFVILSTMVTYTWRRKVISLSALVGAFLVGILMLYNGFFWLLAIALFFILAVGATRWKRSHKKKLRVRQQQRTWKNVVGNGTIPGLFAVLYAVSPSEFLFVGFTASIAAALADTLATELGPLRSVAPRLIISGRRVSIGTNGGITLLGIGASALGSCIIALIMPLAGYDLYAFLIVAIAGFLGSITDSMIGSLFENRRYFDGNVTNILGIFTSSLIAVALFFHIS